jgi:hypothetical protein
MGRGKVLRNYQLNEIRIADIFDILRKNPRGYFKGDQVKGVIP